MSFMDKDDHITGQQLLDELKAMSPADLKKPVGICGHYGEFYPITQLPNLVSVNRDYQRKFGKVAVIQVERIDVGEAPD